MMKIKYKISLGLSILTLAGLCSCVIPRDCLAAFSLSATPFEGGFDMRFSKVNATGPAVNEELTLNITSDTATQYRIYQSILEPLTNGQGATISANNFFVYAVRGTNKFGTLSVESQMPVSLGRTIIYTSGSQGASDSFNLVYGLQGPFDVPSGQYRGRIAFSLEPIGAAENSVTTILNVFADIQVESSISLKTATGSKTITLNSARVDTKFADVLVDIVGGMGNQFRILQVIDQPLTSSEGNQFSGGAVTFEVKEVKKGTGVTTPTNVAAARQEIYISAPAGEADSFIITYSLGNYLKEKAGKYRTNIKYLLEGSGYIKQGLIDTLTLEVENERKFDLIVSPEMGGTLQFRDLKPQQPPRINEVKLEVQSNTGKRYQVSQNTPSLFTSPEGQTIPAKFFTLREESLSTKGILKFTDKTEVKPQEMPLFVSDQDGSSDVFKVIYELAIPPDLHAGDYSTRLVYTLSEI